MRAGFRIPFPKPGTIVYIPVIPIIWKAETGGFLSSRPELYSKTLFWMKEQNIRSRNSVSPSFMQMLSFFSANALGIRWYIPEPGVFAGFLGFSRLYQLGLGLGQLQGEQMKLARVCFVSCVCACVCVQACRGQAWVSGFTLQNV